MNGVVAMPRSPVLDLGPLLGSWRLESFGLTFSDTGERVEPYGPHPDGHMVLETSGRIMFLFAKANRPAPTSNSDRAALFNDMTAYTGLMHLDGPGRFITTIDLAWNPAWQGEQLRFFTLEGDRLTIQSAEQTHPSTGDRLLVGDLVWTRE